MQKTSTDHVQKYLLRNFLVNVTDGAFFGFGIGFASFTTIIPLLVSQFTNSPILIGLIPAIHSMGWQLPQLFTAKKVSQLPHLKRYVLLMTVQERAPFLGLAIISLFLGRINPTLALILIFSLLVWQGLGAGITANGWQNMISKVIPSTSRGTFFGTQSAAANLLASIGAVIAGFLLQNNPANIGFPICFMICVAMMGVSWIFLSLTKEPKSEPSPTEPESKPLWNNIVEILKKDKPFRQFFISRMVYQIGMMGFSFFIIYWVKKIQIMNVAVAGIMTGILMFTQVVTGPVLGWIADHWGTRNVFIFGTLSGAVSLIVAWLVPSPGWAVLVMILAGISSTVFWSVGMSYVLEFGNEQTRPTYVGIINTFGAPIAMLAPLLGGFLAQVSYQITFGVSALFAVITALVLSGLLNKTLRKQPAK